MSRRRTQAASTSTAEETVEEPLIDHTEKLVLHSKKTNRKERRRKRRSEQWHASLGGLPAELFCSIAGYLRPSDVLRLSRTCRQFQSLIQENKTSISKGITTRRYTILEKCFPRPRLLEDVNSDVHEALKSEARRKLLEIHEKPYRHLAKLDHAIICSCLTCVLGWNNLCLIVDLHIWLNSAQPLPLLEHGKNPQWNQEILERQYVNVMRAIVDPLWYARLLELHLNTTTRLITRSADYARYRKSDLTDMQIPYDMDTNDAKQGTDTFLGRKGAPSHEFPFNRDIYHSLAAYVPNRRWHRDEQRWLYPPDNQHDIDIEWVRRLSKPSSLLP